MPARSASFPAASTGPTCASPRIWPRCLDDGQTLRVLPVLGKGSLQNLADILYLRGIDVGIVQSDVLAYAKQRNLYPGIDRSIQYIAKLYDEEVHVLARKDIARLEDLAGKPVNVDVSGSGTAMTASLLFDALGISVQTQNLDEPTAVEKLKRGEIAAVVFVSGQPSRLFSERPARQRPALPRRAADQRPRGDLPAGGTHSCVLSRPDRRRRSGAHDRGGLGHGSVRLAAEQRALCQGRQVRRRVLHQISRTPEATAASEMEGREPRSQGSWLVTFPPGAGRPGTAGCRRPHGPNLARPVRGVSRQVRASRGH